jgi:hypothetical protein
MFSNISSCANQAGIIRAHSQRGAAISQQANFTRIHPCVQEEHTRKIPVASEDAQEGSFRLNPLFLGPGSGHVEEEGVQEADTAQVQTAEQKDPSNASGPGRYSKADSWPPKVALSYGINRREVCCCTWDLFFL